MRSPHGERRRAGLVQSARELISRSPARAAALIFLCSGLLFSGLLGLPIATASGEETAPHDAVFTAFSAITVTGLTTVDTATHWSFFGQIVILIAIQAGGLGIVTLALLLARAVTRQLGVRSKVFAAQNIGTSTLGEVAALLRTVVMTTLIIEGILVAILMPRFIMLEEHGWDGIWHGLFYGISSFNNAGFVLHSGGLAAYDGDYWILLPIMLGVFVGSFGFPVFLTLLAHKWHYRRWTLHAKLTLALGTVLLVAGSLAWGIAEWNNPATIGSLDVGDRVFHAVFASTMMRSGGFSLVDPAQSDPVTLLASDALMFVGGGSASTAGGIKVATLAVLFLAIVAEARGDKAVMVWGRTIPNETFRLAISVTFLGATLVLGATALLMTVTTAPLDRILFEVISAFATCGLSVGLSAELEPFGKYVLAFVMLAGRIGPIGLAAALALRQRNVLFSLPEERLIVG
jgi:Trk-type K+ transport system membrane component